MPVIALASELPALATADDLAARLKTTAPTEGTPERGQWDEVLADASGHVRDVVGNQISETVSTVTLTTTADGYLALPGGPVTAVGDVQVDSGPALDTSQRWLEDSGTLRLPTCPGRRVTVTYTHGWPQVPSELKKWTCVLAAAQLSAAKRGNLGLSGGIAAVAVDDARVTFASSSDEVGAGVEIPERVAQRLRATYGAGGAYVTGHR